MEQPFDSGYEQRNPAPVSVGDWLVTYLITMIPLVGFIMVFVWAFSSDTNPSKANWAKAALIFTLIIIGIYVLIFLIFGAAFMSMMDV